MSAAGTHDQVTLVSGNNFTQGSHCWLSHSTFPTRDRLSIMVGFANLNYSKYKASSQNIPVFWL